MSFTVNPQAIYDHAFQVSRFQPRVGLAKQAAGELGKYDLYMSYGTTCQFFAVGLTPIIDSGQDILQKLANGYDRVATELTNTAKSYHTTDRHAAQNMLVVAGDLAANAMGNSLVDPKSRINVDDAYPVRPGHTGPGAFNPFTAGHDGDWTSGLKIANDAYAMWQQANDSGKRNWGEIAAVTSGFGFKSYQLYADPIGTLTEMGASWAMEHIKPLKAILDGLAGNPTMIKGAANSWNNIGAHLDAIGDQYGAEVSKGTSTWGGPAATNYRNKTAHNLLDSTKSTAFLAKGMAVVVATTGELVAHVRAFVRDLIAKVVAELVKAGLKRLGIGSPTPGELEEIATATSMARTVVNKLIAAFKETLEIVSQLLDMARTVAKIVPLLNGL